MLWCIIGEVPDIRILREWLASVEGKTRRYHWSQYVLIADEAAHGQTTPAHATHEAAREADMTFTAEAHAVSYRNGLCAVGRSAEHADGFLAAFGVVVRDAIHVHVVVGLWLAQLRGQVGLLVARRRI